LLMALRADAKRHQHVDAPIGLHDGVHQRFHLSSVSGVCGHRERHAARTGQLVGQCLDALDAPGAQHHGCTLHGEHAGSRLAQPAARICDDDDVSFDSGTYLPAPFVPVISDRW
jgi:hypothetical protein